MSAAVSRLLEVGADPTLRDAAGQTPYDVSAARDTRNQFRRYRAAHPDRHNYAKVRLRRERVVCGSGEAWDAR